MKKLLFLFLVLLFSGSVIGQQASSCKKTCCSKGKQPAVENIDNLDKLDKNNYQLVVVVDSKQFKIEDNTDVNIKSEWVETITINKDDKTKMIWGDKDDLGVAFIYIKEEYWKKATKKFQE